MHRRIWSGSRNNVQSFTFCVPGHGCAAAYVIVRPVTANTHKAVCK
jgi:hypothetical protein